MTTKEKAEQMVRKFYILLNYDFAKPMLPAVIKLQELNLKNEQKDGYSLGDVLLLDKWEKDLKANGFSKDEIEMLSPSYYGR